MNNKKLYILTAICMMAVCAGLSWIDVEKKNVRVHQHREEEWQSTDGQEETDRTKLPIIKIDTGGQKIPGARVWKEDFAVYEMEGTREETITATFALIDGQEGSNGPDDRATVESAVSIRYRGNSSRLFDKKSFSLHLVDDQGQENPQPLAGMAAHDEWVLNGPFLDRTLLRNYLCMNVAGEVMDYAPNVRYCELYVDGAYQGLYLLMETISRGNGRLNLTRPEEGRAMTSYLVRWDRTGKGDQELDNFAYYTDRGGVSSLDVRYPGKNLITAERKRYIEQDISRIEKVIYSYDLIDREKGITQYIDLEEFAEYFVINEFFRNVDAGRFSTFYYKDVRGKVKPCVWDFNNACDNYIDYVWDETGFSLQDAPWFSGLLRDERFVRAVVRKYRSLRKSFLSEEYLCRYVDETVEWLGTEVEKNYQVWGYVFEPPSGTDDHVRANYLQPMERNMTGYEEAVEQLKEFMEKRGDWLDEHIDSLYQYCHDSKTVNELTR